MTVFRAGLTLIVLCARAAAAPAQQQPVAIRPIGSVQATAVQRFGVIEDLRVLPGGRVMVNDAERHQVVLLDPDLANPVVVADSTDATARAYGPRPAGLIPYVADSSLLADATALSFIVLDPKGQPIRVAPVPRPQDIAYLTSPIYGVRFDGKGNLIYEGRLPSRSVVGQGGDLITATPDSAPILRVNIARRTADTVAWVGLSKSQPPRTVRAADGKSSTVFLSVAPYRPGDDWTLDSDGSIAIIRASDYHVDWVSATGQRTSSGKVAFPWQHLGADDKARVMDSVKAAYVAIQRYSDSAAACRPKFPGGVSMSRVVYEPVSPADLPDVVPPFYTPTARSDADDNIWVQEILSRQDAGGPVYDVLNRQGELFDRVRLPANATVAGFGPGVAYLAIRDSVASPPLPPPDPATGCRPAGIGAAAQPPAIRLVRVRIH